MALIPCTTGCLALFSRPDGGVDALPVEAWDERGMPYVAGAAGLEAAVDRVGFVRLEQRAVVVPAEQQVRQPVPGRRPPVRPAPGDEREPRTPADKESR